MQSKLLPLMLHLIVLTIFLAACNANSPQAVVTKMYDALSEGDMDKYMDTILPENRRHPNLFGVISAISVRVDPISVDLSKLTAVSIRDLKTKIISSSGNYALVQANGKVRYTILTLELDFCDQHDVRKVDGQWYVDVYAPEKTERLTELLGLRVQEILDAANNPNSPQLGLFDSLTQGMDSALNLCN